MQRILAYTTDLLAGTLTAPGLSTAWKDWFDLAGAFVTTYGSVDLEDLKEESGFGPETEWVEGEPPTGLLRGYLLTLELELDLYPDTKRGT